MQNENNKKQQISMLYAEISEKLNITQTQFDKATTSYEAVGKYLQEKLNEKVDIFPQGSMALGTVVRPSDDSEDFDIDLVCRLNDGVYYLPPRIKKSVGKALLEHEVYNDKIHKEGKRCWTIEYDTYHMDVLPSVPLPNVPGSVPEVKDTKIRITHKNSNGSYESRLSNPEGYREWFLFNANNLSGGKVIVRNSREFGQLVKMPMYKMRLPLQKAIQLLKRHRNIVFSNVNGDLAPISIIITTLATKAYDGETDLYTLLDGILQRMPQHVTIKDGKYWIENPVMPAENFADKWDNQKYVAFARWCARAREDLVLKPLEMRLPDIVKLLEACLGEKPTRGAYEEILNRYHEARKQGRLVVNGCRGGLGISSSCPAVGLTTKVMEHTFFGE